MLDFFVVLVVGSLDFLELDARIDINIRKEKISEIIYKTLKLNTENYSVYLEETPVLLTKTEFCPNEKAKGKKSNSGKSRQRLQIYR